jgi:Tfp pilus assembly protein PilF
MTEYREALTLSPESSEAYSNLGRTLLAMNRPDAAADAFRNALLLNPKLASTQYLLGTALAELERLPEAATAFESALKDPALTTHPEIHNDYGVVLGRLGRSAEAAAQFREALRLNPNFDAARAKPGDGGGGLRS